MNNIESIDTTEGLAPVAGPVASALDDLTASPNKSDLAIGASLKHDLRERRIERILAAAPAVKTTARKAKTRQATPRKSSGRQTAVPASFEEQTGMTFGDALEMAVEYRTELRVHGKVPMYS